MAKPWEKDTEIKGSWDNDVLDTSSLKAEVPVLPKEGLGSYYTKDIPEVFKGLDERFKARVEASNAPTQIPGIPGFLAETLPRSALGAGATLADIALGAPADLAMRAGNRLTGGSVNKGLGSLANYVSKISLPGGQGQPILPYLAKQFNNLTPAELANWKAAGYGGEILGTGLPGAKQAASLVPTAVKAIPKATETAASLAARAVEKPVTAIASELSGVPGETLAAYGASKASAKAISGAAGTEQAVGEELVQKIRNIDQYLPEKDVIAEAIPNMPAVSSENVIRTLETAKKPGITKEVKAVNAQIDGKIQEVRDMAPQGTMTAQQALELRRELDGIVDDAFGKESNDYVTALKRSRHTLAQDLVTSANQSGNTQYASAMKSMASKLQSVDKLKQWLGSKASVQDSRAQQFVSTLFGKNKTDRQRVVQELSNIFGKDFIGESKQASQAAQLGIKIPGRKPAPFSMHTTGKSALGVGLSVLGTGGYNVAHDFAGPAAPLLYAAGGLLAPAAALSSPRIAAQVVGKTKRLADLSRRPVVEEASTFSPSIAAQHMAAIRKALGKKISVRESLTDIQRMKLAPKPEDFQKIVDNMKNSRVTQGVKSDSPAELFFAAQEVSSKNLSKKISEMVASGHMSLENALKVIDREKLAKNLTEDDWQKLHDMLYEPLGSEKNPGTHIPNSGAPTAISKAIDDLDIPDPTSPHALAEVDGGAPRPSMTAPEVMREKTILDIVAEKLREAEAEKEAFNQLSPTAQRRVEFERGNELDIKGEEFVDRIREAIRKDREAGNVTKQEPPSSIGMEGPNSEELAKKIAETLAKKKKLNKGGK